MAAMAASCPLLPGPSPARANASSTELVVSTPNAIGMPVAAAASVNPCATAEAMNSKWGVSPRITQPRQTTASNRPLSAACWAASGISNAPGTRTTVTSAGATPADDSAASAPACRRSVTKSLYFDTTSANRNPAARPVASIVSIVASAYALRASADRRPTLPGTTASHAMTHLAQLTHSTCATYLPLNSGLRFCRNAAVPSRVSSVDATSPNRVASYWLASANGISMPLLTALMM